MLTFYFLFIAMQLGSSLPKDKAAVYRVARAHKNAERVAVDSALDQFFTLRDDGYHNERAEAELGKRVEFHNKLSAAGRKRWQQPGMKPGSSQAGSLAIASPQPQPQSEKETSKTAQAPETGALVIELPDWLPLETWNAFLDMRRQIRKPMKPYAVKLAIKKTRRASSGWR